MHSYRNTWRLVVEDMRERRGGLSGTQVDEEDDSSTPLFDRRLRVIHSRWRPGLERSVRSAVTEKSGRVGRPGPLIRHEGARRGDCHGARRESGKRRRRWLSWPSPSGCLGVWEEAEDEATNAWFIRQDLRVSSVARWRACLSVSSEPDCVESVSAAPSRSTVRRGRARIGSSSLTRMI